MSRIDPEIIMHKLHVDPSYQPVRQKKRKFTPERDAIINEEIKNLLDTGFIREVQYPEWLANVVVVNKEERKVVGLHRLHGPKQVLPERSLSLDSYRQTRRSTVGHRLMSFMNALSGYNQILMHPEDQEKTSFMHQGGSIVIRSCPSA